MRKPEGNAERRLARAVGAAIAGRRKAQGMTQAQLAELMNVEKETISRMETGAISPTLHRLAQLAMLLECEIADFLQTRTPEFHQQVSLLAGKLEHLSESQRTKLIEIFGKIGSTIVESVQGPKR